MPLTQLQHYMVLAQDLEKTRHFYCDVLGLRVGDRPAFRFKGLWIYVGEVACIHVAERASYELTSPSTEDARAPGRSRESGSGSVDHIAFAATDFDELVRRFEQHGVRYRASLVPGRPLRQLFVHDPDGIQIEINIRSQPA